MKITNAQKAHMALLAVQIVYGLNYLIAKGIMPDKIEPAALIFIRLSAGGLLFWFIKFFLKEIVDRADIGRLALCGLLGACINQLLFFKGLSITSPIDASIIMTSTPVFVMIISAVLLRETITSQKIVGLFVGGVGAVLLIYAGATNKGTGTVFGNALILINALSFSFTWFW